MWDKRAMQMLAHPSEAGYVRSTVKGTGQQRPWAKSLGSVLMWCWLGTAAHAQTSGPDDESSRPSPLAPPASRHGDREDEHETVNAVREEAGSPAGQSARATDRQENHRQENHNANNNAEDPAEPPPPTSGWTALPVATYAPETELGLGAFAAHFFRLGEHKDHSRPSSIAGVGLVTTRSQVVLELIPELYWDEDRYRLWSKVDYRHYPNSFWGIGANSPDSAREWYTEDGPRAQVQLRRQVAGHLYLEGRVDAHFARMKDTEPGGLLDTNAVTGANASRVLGVGPAIGWDSRDHILSPHRGGLYELSILQFHRALLSQFTFSRIELNLRRYLPVTHSHTLALQVYSELAFGLVPFHRMPMLGGQRLLRGYFEGRYRDRALLLAQAEYRMPLFWRIGLVAFAGFGEVAQGINQFAFKPFKWSVGGGLRFMLSEAEKLNLRVDAGFGHRTWGLYVGIAEAY